LYKHILHFQNTSSITPLTESTIAITAETTTFTHAITTSAFAVAEAEVISSTYTTVSTSSTTTTITTTTTIKIYFIKLSGISQGDPMEGLPQYSGGNRRNC
jgi:hypothetical protein